MKYNKKLPLIAVVNAICLSLLILILPKLAEAQGQCEPLTIAISGFNPKEEEGVLKLARICKRQGGNALGVSLTFPGINVFNIDLDNFLTKTARKILEEKREFIKKTAKTAVKAPCKDRKIHIICHSWGCTLALRVAWDLKKLNIPVETMILLDLIKRGYPKGKGIQPPQDTQGRPRVPDNVNNIFIVRQTWDRRPFLVGDQDVVIDNPQKTNEVGNFHLRRKNPTEEERALLKAVQQEFEERHPGRELSPGGLHNFVDDSKKLRRLAFASVNHPCKDNLACSGPLSGIWTVVATAPSSFICTAIVCDNSTGVCSCEPKNVESPIVEGTPIVGAVVCHEGNTLAGYLRPFPQQTFTFDGSVKPSGSPGILDDHVSFVSELRGPLIPELPPELPPFDPGCSHAITSVVGDGIVKDSGLLGTLNVEGNWQRTDRFFEPCQVCPPPGNLFNDCVSSGSFETRFFSPSTEQSSSTDVGIGAWRKKLTQDYKTLGLNLKCTLTSPANSASVARR